MTNRRIKKGLWRYVDHPQSSDIANDGDEWISGPCAWVVSAFYALCQIRGVMSPSGTLPHGFGIIVELLVSKKRELPPDIISSLSGAFKKSSVRNSNQNRQQALKRIENLRGIDPPEFISVALSTYNENAGAFWKHGLGVSIETGDILRVLYNGLKTANLSASIHIAFYSTAIYVLLQELMKLCGMQRCSHQLLDCSAKVILGDNFEDSAKDEVISNLEEAYGRGSLYSCYANKLGGYGIYFLIFVVPRYLYEKYINKTSDVETVTTHYKAIGMCEMANELGAISAGNAIMENIRESIRHGVQYYAQKRMLVVEDLRIKRRKTGGSQLAISKSAARSNISDADTDPIDMQPARQHPANNRSLQLSAAVESNNSVTSGSSDSSNAHLSTRPRPYQDTPMDTDGSIRPSANDIVPAPVSHTTPKNIESHNSVPDVPHDEAITANGALHGTCSVQEQDSRMASALNRQLFAPGQTHSEQSTRNTNSAQAVAVDAAAVVAPYGEFVTEKVSSSQGTQNLAAATPTNTSYQQPVSAPSLYPGQTAGENDAAQSNSYNSSGFQGLAADLVPTLQSTPLDADPTLIQRDTYIEPMRQTNWSDPMQQRGWPDTMQQTD
ncbi:hypothetical protein AJ80_09887, partial [Polytolypa hystricis UAMH7299]